MPASELSIASTPTSTPPSTSTSAPTANAANTAAGAAKNGVAAGGAVTDGKLANATATDDTQEFLATLTALLNDGATVVPTSTVAATPTSAENKADVDSDKKLDADADDAAVQALLLGLPPGTATAVSPGTAGEEAAKSGSAQAALTANIAAAGRNDAAATKTVSVDGSTDTHAGKLDGATGDEALKALTTKQADTATFATVAGVADKKRDTVEATRAGSDPTVALSVEQRNQQTTRDLPPIAARVGTPQWTDDVAARVALLSDKGMHAASLRLSPEHLGPLEIQITVKNDQATVWFGAAHADTRSALEQALPRLRELMQSQGLVLSDAGVFREPPRDQPRAYRNSEAASMANAITPVESDVRLAVSKGLLDAYA